MTDNMFAWTDPVGDVNTHKEALKMERTAYAAADKERRRLAGLLAAEREKSRRLITALIKTMDAIGRPYTATVSVSELEKVPEAVSAMRAESLDVMTRVMDTLEVAIDNLTQRITATFTIAPEAAESFRTAWASGGAELYRGGCIIPSDGDVNLWRDLAVNLARAVEPFIAAARGTAPGWSEHRGMTSLGYHNLKVGDLRNLAARVAAIPTDDIDAALAQAKLDAQP